NRPFGQGPKARTTPKIAAQPGLASRRLPRTEMGRPPVMPPQPAGVWNTVYNDSKWTDATGPNRYRRAVYTYVKRTSGYPSFLMFDASDRDTSLPRRIPTNTPLQALVTLNDPVYQEAAEALAKRVMETIPAKTSSASGAGETLDARLAYETRLVLSRDPTPGELTALRAFYSKALGTPREPALVNAS